MGKHGKELTIADKQTIISMIEGAMRARKVAEILDRSESTESRFLKRYQETGNRKKAQIGKAEIDHRARGTVTFQNCPKKSRR
jgi:IS30 family transposase